MCKALDVRMRWMSCCKQTPTCPDRAIPVRKSEHINIFFAARDTSVHLSLRNLLCLWRPDLLWLETFSHLFHREESLLKTNRLQSVGMKDESFDMTHVGGREKNTHTHTHTHTSVFKANQAAAGNPVLLHLTCCCKRELDDGRVKRHSRVCVCGTPDTPSNQHLPASDWSMQNRRPDFTKTFMYWSVRRIYKNQTEGFPWKINHVPYAAGNLCCVVSCYTGSRNSKSTFSNKSRCTTCECVGGNVCWAACQSLLCWSCDVTSSHLWWNVELLHWSWFLMSLFLSEYQQNNAVLFSLQWAWADTRYYSISGYLPSYAIFFIILNSGYCIFSFYFEKKMNVEQPWQQKQRSLLFDEVKRLSQVNWHDVGMCAALKHTDMKFKKKKNPARRFGNISGLKQKKMASSSFQQ